MVTWVIEKNVFNDREYNRFINHFKVSNIPYKELSIKPVERSIIGKTPVIDGPVVAYGSIGIDDVCKQNSWAPGVFSSPDFNCAVYQDKLGKDFLNWDMNFIPLSCVETMVDKPEPFFIRPKSDFKNFAGDVMTSAEFTEWHNQMMTSGYLTTDDAHITVGIAQATTIYSEWRNVVVNGEVISTSLYRTQGRKVMREESNLDVRKCVDKAVWRFNPTLAFMVDVAFTPDGYKVIEYNTFNSAGMYANNIENIVDAINKEINYGNTIKKTR